MSAISDDTQDGLAINKVQPKKLADLQFALDQHATVAVTDIRGIVNSVNQKFCVIHQYAKVGRIGQNHRLLNSGCHSQEFFEQLYRAIAHAKVWHGEKQPGLRTVRPRHGEQFNTNRSQLTGQLERIDGGLQWENRKS